MNQPAKAINDPEALPILLGRELPNDIRAQLKVRDQLRLGLFARILG